MSAHNADKFRYNCYNPKCEICTCSICKGNPCVCKTLNKETLDDIHFCYSDACIKCRCAQCKRNQCICDEKIKTFGEHNPALKEAVKKAASSFYIPNDPNMEEKMEKIDNVNSPPHYNTGRIEVIEYIEDLNMGEDFCAGNAIKYISRYKHKGNPIEDLKKSKWYIERLIKILENKNIKSEKK